MLSSCVVAASRRHAAPVATTRPGRHGMTPLEEYTAQRRGDRRCHAQPCTGHARSDGTRAEHNRAQLADPSISLSELLACSSCNTDSTGHRSCAQAPGSQSGIPDHVKPVPPYSGRPGHAPPVCVTQQPQASSSAAHAASVHATPPTVPSTVFLDSAWHGGAS